MNENHSFEPHTETASDHFCARCGGYHDWRAIAHRGRDGSDGRG